MYKILIFSINKVGHIYTFIFIHQLTRSLEILRAQWIFDSHRHSRHKCAIHFSKTDPRFHPFPWLTSLHELVISSPFPLLSGGLTQTSLCSIPFLIPQICKQLFNPELPWKWISIGEFRVHSRDDCSVHRISTRRFARHRRLSSPRGVRAP